MNDTMRALTHDRFGDPKEVLRLTEDLAVPAPGNGEILIRITVRPMHPGDLFIIAGGADGATFPQPRIPGFEGAGVVVAVGSEVSDIEPGQRVALFPATGAWGEYLTVDPASVVPVPDSVDDATASMMLINPLTVRMLLRAAAEAWAGDPRPTIQTAAGSSVGRLIAAAAERHDYPLVNLVRSPAGAAALSESFPSLHTFTTSDPKWPDQVREVLGGPASVVLDPVGGSLAIELLYLLEDGGALLSYGALAGPPPDAGALNGRPVTLRFVTVGEWSSLSREQRSADVSFALDLAQTRTDLFGVAATYDLSDFGKAIEAVSRPGKVGTVLLSSPSDGAHS